jgi:hypothetical protein
VRVTDRRKLLPTGLVGLAGLACLGCCLVPFLLAAGVLAGAGWAAVLNALPVAAAGFAVVAVLVWWVLFRQRKTHSCSPGCTCSVSR